MTNPDWSQIRKFYPATDKGAYLNSAAVGPFHDRVFQTYEAHQKKMWQHGDWDWRSTIVKRDEFREELARDLKTRTSHIGFCPNTSHNMNLLALYHKTDKPQKVVAARDEFPSTYMPWAFHGYEVVFIETKEDGSLDPEEYLKAAREHEPEVVLCSTVQFATGFRMPMGRLCDGLKDMGVPLIVNATQSIGAFPFDFESISCHVMVASVHKWLCAGYGMSILAFRPDIELEKPLPFAGWMSVVPEDLMQPPPVTFRREASAVETGCPPFSVIQGAQEAWKVAMEIGLENIAGRMTELSSLVVSEAQSRGIKVLSKRDDKHWSDSVNSGTVLLDIPGGEETEIALQKQKVFISARRNGIRVACHYFNNEQDVTQFFDALKNLK